MSDAEQKATYELVRQGRYVFYNFGNSKRNGKQVEVRQNMPTDDTEVRTKFLNVIREKRREKYGRMVYGSDGTTEENFDSEGYFRELVIRNKIRQKLQKARQKRNSMRPPDDDEDEEEERTENTPSLLSKIIREENGSSQGHSSTHVYHNDAKYDSKDSGKGTPSADTVTSYNDGSTRHNSASKTMRRVKMKIRSVNNFSSACDELKERYKKEKEKQMDFLETIRLLRGINKEDFYKDVESDVELEDDDVIENRKSKLTFKEPELRNVISKSETVSDVESERDLTPIANQMLTPDRLETPTSANLTPEPESEPEQDGTIHMLRETGDSTEVPVKSPDAVNQENMEEVNLRKDDLKQLEIKNDPMPSLNLKNKTSKAKRKKKRIYTMINTPGCKIDSRWPKGHKLFTMPSSDDPDSGHIHNDCFACYEKLIRLQPSKPVDSPRKRRQDLKINKINHEYDSWRETLIRIAYEKEFEYLKKPSLHLFPFQKSALESMVSLEKLKAKQLSSRTAKSSRPRTTNNQTQGKIERDSKSSENNSKPSKVLLNEIKFQSLKGKIKSENDTVRTKSGHASNDQGYDSQEDMFEMTTNGKIVQQDQVHNKNSLEENGHGKSDINETNPRTQKLQVWKKQEESH